PTYHMKIRQGKELNLSTFFIDYSQLGKGGFEKRRSVYVIAQDGDAIVGHHFEDYGRDPQFAMYPGGPDKRETISEGTIFTDKGHGYAIPIELVITDIFQREANNRGIEIEWRAKNANISALEDVRAKHPADSAEVRVQEEENLRWNRIWGEGGLLGIIWGENGAHKSEYGSRRFVPQTKNQQQDMPWEIVCSRDETTGLMVIEKEERPNAVRRMVAGARRAEVLALITKIQSLADQYREMYLQSVYSSDETR
ncbi:MAG: hypothetical protein KGL95_04085, partial [Patescibacteria group bacterium]|nr:hypothetical protein [Patescibacteria group bacterium]